MNVGLQPDAVPTGPQRVKEKARVTLSFLQRKMDEYEQIKQEIARLKAEAQQSGLVPDEQ